MSSSVLDAFQSDGYFIVRSVFSADEVKELRSEVLRELSSQGIYKGGGVVLPNAAVNGAVVPGLVAQPRILSTVREILREERPLFTLEADLHCNFLASSWHKDSGESVLEGGYFNCDPIGRTDCLVIKVAIYLQDHSRAGGLNIRPGSHQTTSLSEGGEMQLRTGSGDVIIFDSRLTHRGSLPSFGDRAISRSIGSLPIREAGRTVARLRSIHHRIFHRPDRLAIYFAYGIHGERTLTFAERNMERQLLQYGGGSSALSQDVEESIRGAGIDVVSVGP